MTDKHHDMEDHPVHPDRPVEEEMPVTENTINLREVIRSKSERLARILPGFVYRYLEKILHVEENNRFLYENRNKHGLDFVEAAVRLFNLSIYVDGIEKIPPDGRCTLVSNHPLGGLDGIAILHTVGKVRQDIKYPVNDLLLFLPNMRSIFIPINKHGRNVEHVTAISDTFAGDNIIPYFPAGLCSRKQSGKIIDLEWKSTFISKSKRNNRLVIPVHFSGRNSSFFYNLALLRKFLRIKANIEMFYLVNEMYKQYDKKVIITIGDPIPAEKFDNSKKPHEWAAWVKAKVYELDPGKKKKYNDLLKID